MQLILRHPFQFHKLVLVNSVEVVLLKFVLGDIAEVLLAEQGAPVAERDDGVIEYRPAQVQQQRYHVGYDVVGVDHRVDAAAPGTQLVLRGKGAVGSDELGLAEEVGRQGHMRHQPHVNRLPHELVQVRVVVDRGLVKFEHQHLVGKVQQQHRDGTDEVQHRDDAAERQTDDEYSNEEGISLLYGVHVVTEEMHVLLLRLAAGRSETALAVPALLETLEYVSQDEFYQGKGDVEYHCEDDDRANVHVPVSSDIAVLPLHQEVETGQVLQVDVLLVLGIEQDDDQPHVHNQQEGPLDGVAVELVGDEGMRL
jgi:hypothetical protein